MPGETDPNTRRKGQARFVAVFLGVAAVLFAVYAFPYPRDSLAARAFEGYLAAYAQLSGGFLALFDSAVHVQGNLIAGRFSMSIVRTCDAMEANVLFLAAVAAFPAPWTRKLAAAVVGLVALVLVNLVRICSLYFVGVYAPAAFERFHVEIWPLVLVVFTVANFLAWTRWLSAAPPQPA